MNQGFKAANVWLRLILCDAVNFCTIDYRWFFSLSCCHFFLFDFVLIHWSFGLDIFFPKFFRVNGSQIMIFLSAMEESVFLRLFFFIFSFFNHVIGVLLFQFVFLFLIFLILYSFSDLLGFMVFFFRLIVVFLFVILI